MTAPVLTAAYREALEAQGLAAALELLRADVLPGLLPCGPAGHAVVAEAALAAGGLWVDGTVVTRPATRETVSTVGLPGGALVMLRHPNPVPTMTPVDSVSRHQWRLGLVWLRLAVSESLRDRCLRYLTGREVGGQPLVRQQLVRAAVAEAAIEHLEVRAVLAGPAPTPWYPHERITAADRLLVPLFGASGYLADGPGQLAYVSELLADAYAAPEELW